MSGNGGNHVVMLSNLDAVAVVTTVNYNVRGMHPQTFRRLEEQLLPTLPCAAGGGARRPPMSWDDRLRPMLARQGARFWWDLATLPATLISSSRHQMGGSRTLMLMRWTWAVGALARKPARTFAVAGLFAVLDSACERVDVTRATGMPDAVSSGVGAPPEAAVAPSPGGSSVEPVAAPGATPEGVREPPAAANELVDPIVAPSSGENEASRPVATQPFDCSTIPEAPVAFEILQGFTASEDFAFDELGNYVGVDGDRNLIRVAKTGEKQLWSPAIGATAGMGMLPDGSVVFCDVEDGAIKRAYPNGSVAVVLGGLLYPNGLDIGPDGFIYVAENAAGRVRRINPDTGEFSIVAVGLHGPNGVAFGNDPSLLYVGSFEGSGVYKVKLDVPGELGYASVFARPGGSTLRGPSMPCLDQQEEGAVCLSEYFMAGTCQALANVVDCMPTDPCPYLPDESYCDHPSPGGICRGGRCEVLHGCDGLAEGDPCEAAYVEAGVCEDSGGELYCTAPNPCAGLGGGAACEDPFFGTGECQGTEAPLYCAPPNPCIGLREGDECEDPFSGSGVCTAYGDEMYCGLPNPCERLRAGEACEDPYFGAGLCKAYSIDGAPISEGDAEAEEGAEADEGAEVDEAAGADAGTGGAVAVYCEPPNICDGLAEGTPCSDPPSGVVGVCAGGYCSSGSVGGIDGLGVDACGNVYASEFVYGNVWRISPRGHVELLAQLPSSWVPNIKWGRGLGGFSRDVMYVADRDESRLFGVSVGVPGATEFFAMEPK